MPSWEVKIGGASGSVATNVEVRGLKMGYAFARECTLFFPGDHDVGLAQLTNNNEIWVSKDGFTTLAFRGYLEVNSPKGVGSEGVEYSCYGLEAAANRFLIKFNQSMSTVYNIDNLPDYSSPNPYGGRWTVGQIMVDILEHAIDIPIGGSKIPKHHPNPNSVTNAYMPARILRSYNADDLLTLDLELPEVRVTAQRFWDYLKHLIEQEDHHGLFIDPSNPTDPTLVMHDYTTSTVVDFKFGKRDEHILDTATVTEPLVVDNQMELSINTCKTKIIIEGKGQLRELVPITQGGSDDGTLVPHWSDTQITGDIGRSWIIKDSQKYVPFWEGTLSNGFKGPLLVLDGRVCSPDFAHWDLQTGSMSCDHDLRSFTTIEVWTLYLAPFQVIAGPGGDAYDNYHLIREEGIYDDSLIHASDPICVQYNLISTYMAAGGSGDCSSDYNQQQTDGEEYCLPMAPRDDTPLMQAIADTMLSRLGNERVSCKLTLDTITDELLSNGLKKKGNLINLQKWSNLGAQVMSIEVDIRKDQLMIQLTNDVFRTPSYAEWKRRFMLRTDANILARVVDSIRHITKVGGRTSFTRG